MKYIAIKVKGLSCWLWFIREAVTEADGRFIGKDGWGLDGAQTSVDVPTDQIVGRIESDLRAY